MGEQPAEPRQIGDALDRVLKGLGTPGTAAVRTVFSSWDVLVGTEAAAHARPASLDRGCLLIVVDSPAWATRMRYESATLLRHIADELGEGVVTRVDIRVRTSKPG